VLGHGLQQGVFLRGGDQLRHNRAFVSESYEQASQHENIFDGGSADDSTTHNRHCVPAHAGNIYSHVGHVSRHGVHVAE
jgi:hypothetical protein